MRARILLPVLLSALCMVALLAGCGRTVEGTARPAGDAGGSAHFRDLLRECQVVPENQIAQAVGGSSIDDEFFGAVCRWTVDAGAVFVTSNWFETGSVEREAQAARRLGYRVDRITVSGVRGIAIRPPDDPASCGVDVPAAAAGVIGWWVQAGDRTVADPCGAAKRLAQLSLRRDQ